MSSLPTAPRQRPPASHNLVELVRRHHAERAPTALQVLKKAVERAGEITDADRRVAAERSRLPEAAVHGISTFYDDLLQPRGRRHIRVCTGTARFAACGDDHVTELNRGLGLALGQRAEDRSVSLAEAVCLGFCHSAPAVRDINTSCPEYKVIAVDVRPMDEEPAFTPAMAEPVAR
jgi:bidirectional [NiFe] hydrogenase diaphorase subunit